MASKRIVNNYQYFVKNDDETMYADNSPHSLGHELCIYRNTPNEKWDREAITVSIRNVGDRNPKAVIQFSIRTTHYYEKSNRSTDTYTSFSIPENAVQWFLDAVTKDYRPKE